MTVGFMCLGSIYQSISVSVHSAKASIVLSLSKATKASMSLSDIAN